MQSFYSTRIIRSSRIIPSLSTPTRRTLRLTAINRYPSHFPGTEAPSASIDEPSSKSVGENRPASETTGTDAKPVEKNPDMKESGLHSSTPQSSPGDNRHPAKQPDTQEQPSRSTGIGNQSDVKSTDPAGSGSGAP